MKTGLDLFKIIHELDKSLIVCKNTVELIYIKNDSLINSDNDLKKKLNTVERQLDNSLKLVMEIRNSVPKTSNPKPVELWELVEEALLRITIPPTVNVNKIRNVENSIILGNHQIITVIENLLNNAIEAMPEGGEITIAVLTSSDIRFFDLKISDNGIGISPDIQEGIFHSIQSTKKHGLGIGLWWSNQVIKQLGGNMNFLSEQGKGTSFVISLPKP